MTISKRTSVLTAISLFAVLGLSQIVLESYADARAGGGRSGGFRGSRSYQAPARPTQPSARLKPAGKPHHPSNPAGPLGHNPVVLCAA